MSTIKKESMIITTKWIMKTEKLQKNNFALTKKDSNLLKALSSSYKKIHSILKQGEKGMNFMKYVKIKNNKLWISSTHRTKKDNFSSGSEILLFEIISKEN
jgi:hypothetical protein